MLMNYIIAILLVDTCIDLYVYFCIVFSEQSHNEGQSHCALHYIDMSSHILESSDFSH